MKPGRVSLLIALGRGARGLCPRCGQGRLFRSWDLLQPQCSHCSLKYEENEGDSWAFMYISTGFITGLFIVGMFLLKPENRYLGFIVVAVLSILVMVGTIPFRKGIAVALDFWLRR